ncbi:MAG TPA: hypothetical protein VGC54_11440 [Planctomycetota bacterium]
MLRNTLLLLGVLSFATPAVAQEPENSAKFTQIAEQLKAVSKKAFEFDMAVVVEAEGNAFKGQGHMAFANPRKFALTFSGSGEQFGETQAVALKLVADGTDLFIEAEDASGGQGTQVMKISMSLFDNVQKLIASQMGGGMTAGDWKPEEALKMLDGLSIQEEKLDGVRRFKTNLDSSVIPQMGEEALGMVLDLHSATGFPKSLAVKGANGEKMHFSTSKLVFPETIADDRFLYTAPEGVFVMDITPMIQMMLDAQLEAVEEF